MWGGLASERKEGRWIINSGCFKKSKTLIRTAVSAVFKHTGFPAGPAGSRAPARAAARDARVARRRASGSLAAPCSRSPIGSLPSSRDLAY